MQIQIFVKREETRALKHLLNEQIEYNVGNDLSTRNKQLEIKFYNRNR